MGQTLLDGRYITVSVFWRYSLSWRSERSMEKCDRVSDVLKYLGIRLTTNRLFPRSADGNRCKLNGFPLLTVGEILARYNIEKRAPLSHFGNEALGRRACAC